MVKSKTRLELTWIGKRWRFHKDAVDAWVKHGLGGISRDSSDKGQQESTMRKIDLELAKRVWDPALTAAELQEN